MESVDLQGFVDTSWTEAKAFSLLAASQWSTQGEAFSRGSIPGGGTAAAWSPPALGTGDQDFSSTGARFAGAMSPGSAPASYSTRP